MAPPNQPPQQSGGSGIGGMFQKKYGPLPLWGWIAVAVVGYYLYKHYSGSSSSASTGTLTSATGSTATGVPSVTVSYPGGGSYSGPPGYEPPGLSGTPTAVPITSGVNPGGAMIPTPAPATTPGTTSSATPGSGSGIPGYGEQSVGGQSFITLGTVNPGGAYSGYNVSGGAPVYFLQPGQSTPQTNISADNLAAGTQVLVPAGYAGAVSSAPATEHI